MRLRRAKLLGRRKTRAGSLPIDAGGELEMVDSPSPPDTRLHPVLRRYARGELSAYDAACEIQDLGIPGYQDPSASEVVLWSRAAGFGIPTPTEEEARAEAEAILERIGRRSVENAPREDTSKTSPSAPRIVDNLPHTRVAPSDIHGNGLFALTDFGKGRVLGTLDGQRIRHADHPEVFDEEWNAISDELLLVRAIPTKYRYINHSETPNCWIEERDMSIRALRDIVAGEELTLDYQARPLPAAYLALPRSAFLRRSESADE